MPYCWEHTEGVATRLSLLGWLGQDEGGGEPAVIHRNSNHDSSLFFLFFDRADVGVADREQVEVLNTLLCRLFRCRDWLEACKMALITCSPPTPMIPVY